MLCDTRCARRGHLGNVSATFPLAKVIQLTGITMCFIQVLLIQFKIGNPEHESSGIGGIMRWRSIASKFNYVFPWGNDNGPTPLSGLSCDP